MSTTVQELPRAAPNPSSRKRRSLLPLEMSAGWVGIIVFFHALYGLMLARSPAIATAHALVTLALAIWIALTSTMRRVAFMCAYIAGSEILWRLGKASLPWEFGKYAICLVIFLTFLRTRRLRWDWPVMLYFAFLIPSTIISFSEKEFDFARKQVSFNLSGPLTLALATWFFSMWRPSREDIQRTFVALLAPIASLAAIAVTHTASLDDLSFSDASNSQTSGGYGPNQVSTILGLGALLTVLLILLLDRGVRERILYAGLGLLFAVESALTFSRGGLFSAFGAMIFAAPFVVSGARSRVALLVGAAVLVGTVEIVILPRLDSFTQGALSERFHDTNPTGRDELIRTELETFQKNPIFGTGPAALDDYGDIASSVHTEFTRLPAQHGIFGLFALLMMFVLATRDFVRQPSAAAKAICVALIAWSMLTMGHAAMRLAMPPFAFGLAAAVFFGAGETGVQRPRAPGARRPSTGKNAPAGVAL